ncbi:3-oxoacyl-ACP synthase [Adhaeribacter aerolatus]|uniref:3-oxoacyl-ACP synthase n=1 Tax=Adhaeribacter aerolatus TaxID=670289 RepID=A0A512AXT5_9BACT|nr:ketoacyl-ACP synthase III [Adhaeribacter aerolatus]GEO04535.1 3-oxoacyl-ACP synthase [Adhaeribacter aerolatus]
MSRVKISYIAHYLAHSRRVSSQEIEAQVNHDQRLLAPGVLERLFGIKNRYFADAGVQCSDLAAGAARKILAQVDPSSIDCLIFAAASSDLIEPATANIVQAKLGLTCPVFDVKNACNSFMTALQVGASLIKSGDYKRVLITNGEILQHAIKFKVQDEIDLMKRLASFTLGDAGTAALLEASEDESGILYQENRTIGKYWELCVIPGGGSMYPQEPGKNYFEGKTSELREVFARERGDLIEKCLEKTGLTRDDIDHYFIHQVSKNSCDALAREANIPIEKVHCIVEEYGNTAAASIPLSISLAEQAGKLKKGQKIMIIGLAAGISMSISLIIW